MQAKDRLLQKYNLDAAMNVTETANGIWQKPLVALSEITTKWPTPWVASVENKPNMLEDGEQ